MRALQVVQDGRKAPSPQPDRVEEMRIAVKRARTWSKLEDGETKEWWIESICAVLAELDAARAELEKRDS